MWSVHETGASPRSTYRKYASRAAIGRRLASDPSSSLSLVAAGFSPFPFTVDAFSLLALAVGAFLLLSLSDGLSFSAFAFAGGVSLLLSLAVGLLLATGRHKWRGALSLMRILEVVGLTKRFAGVTALDAVSFTVEEGHVLGLFGPKLAGKTTRFHCLSGLAAPDGGRVIFDGHEITGYTPHRVARVGIARTFQIVRPFRRLTAVQNVMVAVGHRNYQGPAALLGSWRGRATRARALELLERVGLTAAADREAGHLPLGMLKRLEVARALATGPRLLLLDEVMAGLRPTETDRMVATLQGLNRETGLTVVLIEHVMRAVMALASRVLVLDHGTAIAEDTPEMIVRNPAVVQSYLGQSHLETGAA